MVKNKEELEEMIGQIVQLMSANKTESPVLSDMEFYGKNLGSYRVKWITPWDSKKGKTKSTKYDNEWE